jgi:hypothetical protein
LFSVTAADIRLGSLLATGNGWTLTPTINPTTGEIAIALASSTPILGSIGGSLVTIDFHPVAGVPAAAVSTAISLVSWVNPTGTQVVLTELADAQGTFTLSPAPTNGFDSRIDGVVLGMNAPATPLMETVPVAAPVTGRQDAETAATEPARPAVAIEGVPGEQADSAAPTSLEELPGRLMVHAVPLAESVLLVGAPPLVAGGFTAGLPPAVTEPFFQALARAASISSDPSLVSTRNSTPEGEVLLSGRASSFGSLYNLNWKELDLGWPALAQGEQAVGTARTDQPPVLIAAVTSPAAPPAAVDQYFMQNPDDFTPEMGMDGP